MMTRRRTPISIYDYPEHLNPFRDDEDEGEDIKYHTTGRRRSSFRVNAWAVFAGRGKSPERSTPSPVASRFLTWTPKLLRRASFRRMITPTTQAPPKHKNALSPPPRTVQARPPIPTHINNCTPSSSPAPVPAVRTRRLAQRAGGEDETKYIQQGAKPKKKRRAPAPPTPQPGRASQPQEPETSCSAAQEQPQSSGEQTSATTVTSAECYVEQSRISPSESDETSVTVSNATVEVKLEVTQSNNSLAAEESAVESQSVTISREAPVQILENESAPIVVEETAEIISQDVTVEQNISQTSAGSPGPVEESMETIIGENEVTVSEQSADDVDLKSMETITGENEVAVTEQSDDLKSMETITGENEVSVTEQSDNLKSMETITGENEVSVTERSADDVDLKNTVTIIEENEATITEPSGGEVDRRSTSESIIQEMKFVHQERSDTAESTENQTPSANVVELPLQDSTELENTRELEEYVSVSSTEETSVVMENMSEESPLKITESESSNSLNDIRKEHEYTEEEKSDRNKSLTNAPLENGFGGSDSEISPSKTHLIDEESKPLPKPRTILPEKPTEQDKKP